MSSNSTPIINERDLFVSMALTAWHTTNARVTKLIDTLSTEQFMSETAPGRNRGIYLIGHLLVVSDRLFSLLGLGDRSYSHLDEVFLTNPDRKFQEIPSFEELKKYWHSLNPVLTEKLNSLSSAEWFSRHNDVSVEDFAKEPHRNKLNVLLSRTNHTSSHYGQLQYLVKK